MSEKSCETCPSKHYCDKDICCSRKPKEDKLISENEFEDILEKAYWYYSDKLSKKNFSDRDCFKMSCRKYFRPEHLKPREEKMRKPIFESEEEAKEFIMDIWYIENNPESMIDKLKRKCYIRRSIIEEAEEYYQSWYNDKESNAEIVIDKQHVALQYLKKQLEDKHKLDQ